MLSTLRTQVLVVGSGAAGLTAAIAAGRNGAQTLLVEYHGFLGGISSTLPWLGFHGLDLLQSTLIEQGAELRQSLEDGDPETIDWVGQLPKDEPPTTGEMDEASQGVHAWVR